MKFEGNSLELADTLDLDNELEIDLGECVACDSDRVSLIDKSMAIEIVDHLEKLFGL